MTECKLKLLTRQSILKNECLVTQGWNRGLNLRIMTSAKCFVWKKDSAFLLPGSSQCMFMLYCKQNTTTNIAYILKY